MQRPHERIACDRVSVSFFLSLFVFVFLFFFSFFRYADFLCGDKVCSPLSSLFLFRLFSFLFFDLWYANALIAVTDFFEKYDDGSSVCVCVYMWCTVHRFHRRHSFYIALRQALALFGTPVNHYQNASPLSPSFHPLLL